MTDQFKKCLLLILAHEVEPGETPSLDVVGGKITDSPHDAGGRTNDGILETEYHAWQTKHGQSLLPVGCMTAPERNAIYDENYYTPARCGELPFPLDYVLMDYAVNSGIGQAVKDLQRVVKATPDGSFGPKTKAAILDSMRTACVRFDEGFILRGAHAVAWGLLDRRMDLLQEAVIRNPDNAHNILGWMRRVMRIGAQVISDSWLHGNSMP